MEINKIVLTKIIRIDEFLTRVYWENDKGHFGNLSFSMQKDNTFKLSAENLGIDTVFEIIAHTQENKSKA